MRPLENIISTVSPSKIGTFSKCQFLFYLRYVLGQKRPPGALLAFGRAIDYGTTEAYREAIGGDYPSPGECAELFRESWDVERENVEDWFSEKPDHLTDQGAILIKRWRKEIAESVQPVCVQEKFTLKFKGFDWSVEGIIDLGFRRDDSEQIKIADTKTATTKWDMKKVLSNLQAPGYSMGGIPLFGCPIDNLEFHILVRGKNATQVVERYVSTREREAYSLRIASIRKQIQANYEGGTWLPTGRDSMHPFCSRRWCAFWRECEEQWGGQIAP